MSRGGPGRAPASSRISRHARLSSPQLSALAASRYALKRFGPWLPLLLSVTAGHREAPCHITGLPEQLSYTARAASPSPAGAQWRKGQEAANFHLPLELGSQER